MKRLALALVPLFSILLSQKAAAQRLTLPPDGGNKKCSVSQQIGITDVTITYDAPGVKGREGKIWGTNVAHYGFIDLGFGTTKAAPWRAGANEATVISFSTDVKIEGKPLAAGKYNFFIALEADECTIIFSKNSSAWGSFFYKQEEDALRATVRQQKNLPESREWLAYQILPTGENSATVTLEWERWRIPFRVEVDLNETVVASLRHEMTGAAGFDPTSMKQAAKWCLDHDANLQQGFDWAMGASDPAVGGRPDFPLYSMKSKMLTKMGRDKEAADMMAKAYDLATIFELHGYGRQLIAEKKPAEALAIFQKNFEKNGDKWPTHVGLARGYSATGDLKKALEHARLALAQAPDDQNRTSLQGMVKDLEAGKAVMQ